MRRLLSVTALCAFMAAPAVAGFTEVKPCPFSEPSLVEHTYGDALMDTLYGAGNYLRIDDDFDQLWTNLGGSATAAAKYASATETGGYFGGVVGGSFTGLFILDAGTNGVLGGTPVALLVGSTGTVFRFGISSPYANGLLWSSQPSDNALNEDHMVTFKITGGDDAGKYALGWEIESFATGDEDYQDLVVEVSGVAPVPVPAAVLLGFLGLGAAGLKLRRCA